MTLKQLNLVKINTTFNPLKVIVEVEVGFELSKNHLLECLYGKKWVISSCTELPIGNLNLYQMLPDKKQKESVKYINLAQRKHLNVMKTIEMVFMTTDQIGPIFFLHKSYMG